MIELIKQKSKGIPNTTLLSKKPNGRLYFDNPKNFGGQGYQFNTKGYRNDFEFEDVKNESVNLYFGCSHTFGVGLEKEDVYINHLHKKLNDDSLMVNMGIPSAGIQHITHSIIASVEFFTNIKKIFLWTPHIGTRPYSPEYNLNCNLPYLLNEYQGSMVEIPLSLEMQTIIDVALLNELKSTFENINVYNFNLKDFELIDWAKDGQHYGPQTHKIIADKFNIK